jgi:hypothetical protein
MRLRGGGPLDLFKRAPPPPPPAPVVRMAMPTGSVEILTVIAMAAITHFTRPSTLTSVGGLPTIAHVWYYGWVAALSTGLGALPLIFLGKVTDVWLGLSNAVAAGMMLSASLHLIQEGLDLDADGSVLFGMDVPHHVRVAAGFLMGMG